jgi:hypothetical protein
MPLNIHSFVQTAVDQFKYNESLSDRRAQSTIGWLMGETV